MHLQRHGTSDTAGKQVQWLPWRLVKCRRCVATWVAYGRLEDEQRVVGAVVGDDEAPVAVDSHVGDQSSGESQLVAVESATIVRHELDEVALRRLGDEAEAVAEWVLLRAEAVVRRNHARSTRRLQLGHPLRRREISCSNQHRSAAESPTGATTTETRGLVPQLLSWGPLICWSLNFQRLWIAKKIPDEFRLAENP